MDCGARLFPGARYLGRERFVQPVAFGPFGGSSTNTKSYAAFADLTMNSSDKFFVTAGARYSHDEVTDAYFRTNGGTTSYLAPMARRFPSAGRRKPRSRSSL